jgi:small-conductance mechanosensitive channel
VLAAVAYGWWFTAPAAVKARAGRAHPAAGQPLVDRRALDTAMRLLPLAASPDEQRLAQEAAAAADHLLDLAFAEALRAATDHPPPVTPAAQAAQLRLDHAAQQLVDDNLQIQSLTDAVAKAKRDKAGELDAALALAQSQFEVDQYEFDQAGKALVEAGGDLRGKIQALVAEHKTPAPPARTAVAEPAPRAGLVRMVARWRELHRKGVAIDAACAELDAAAAALANAREVLSQRIHAHGSTQAGGSPTLLAESRQLALDQRELRAMDERRVAERDLARIYAEWRALVTEQSTAWLHRILRAISTLLVACLLLLFLGSWLAKAFDRLKVDRRQVETLRTVTTVTLQVAALFVIVLVILGPPSQLGTMLGLAGAGLTVALKDFIVAFIGWLVLMGRNGIRIGDWVEINGVAGEVVELGMFHTVLLETGNWTDSGHPTGRRVTFTNSFAIQGYYFNFSTSGQWLWDELQLVVPAGQDLYAVVAEISRKVQDATAENGRLAEEEWRRAAPSRQLTGLSAAPAINVKPVLGGTEISLRYISRAAERYALRAKLYEAAVELLAHNGARAPAPAKSPP